MSITHTTIKSNNRHIFVNTNHTPKIPTTEEIKQYKNNRRSIVLSFRVRKEKLQHSL